jgi:hypothetical protein
MVLCRCCRLDDVSICGRLQLGHADGANDDSSL